MRLTKFFDILTLIGEHMGITYTETIYKDTETRFYAVFSSDEDEFCDEETQPPEVEVSHYESPVKRTYPMLAACGTSQSSTSSHNRSSPGSQHTEVQKYLNSGWVEHAVHNLDVLRWWKEHQVSFPILSRFARDVLSVPVSSVSSESAFSSAGLILDERRLSLKSDLVEILTILKDWELADRRSQETARNSAEIIEYFDNLYIEDDSQSTRD